MTDTDRLQAPLTGAELDDLRRLRLSRRLSFRAMADAVGVPAPTLNKVLEGRTPNPNKSTNFLLRSWLEQQQSDQQAESAVR